MLDLNYSNIIYMQYSIPEIKSCQKPVCVLVQSANSNGKYEILFKFYLKNFPYVCASNLSQTFS